MRRTPDIQKHRILGAAIAAFARDGLEGARVDAIAAAADINKRMLYHYFGDKQALFDAALAQAVDTLRTGLAQPPWLRDASEPVCWQLLAGLAGTDRPMPEGLSEPLDGWLAAVGPAAEAADTGARGVLVLALDLVEALMPDLIDARLGPFDSPGERHAAVAALANRVCHAESGSPQKPRIKLKPRIQPV